MIVAVCLSAQLYQTQKQHIQHTPVAKNLHYWPSTLRRPPTSTVFVDSTPLAVHKRDIDRHEKGRGERAVIQKVLRRIGPVATPKLEAPRVQQLVGAVQPRPHSVKSPARREAAAPDVAVGCPVQPQPRPGGRRGAVAPRANTCTHLFVKLRRPPPVRFDKTPGADTLAGDEVDEAAAPLARHRQRG